MEKESKNGIAINHIIRQQLMQASSSCPKQQLKHTCIPNASAKQETATSKLKHELLYNT